MNELIKQLSELLENIDAATAQLDLEAERHRLSELEAEMQSPDFWTNSEAAVQKSQTHAALQKQVGEWDELRSQTAELLELARLQDHKLLNDLTARYQHLRAQYDAKEFELKLAGPHDKLPAILSIHAGTGGTDAQDWAQMLERMYLRWAEKSGLNAEVITESAGEEAGIKSLTMRINGHYAYGRLKSEHGVHRLVRLSPFNADNLRQTSFALVEVVPEIAEAKAIEIDPKDLKIDVYRAGGHGGQSVNTTDSAVRITHLPTGLVVAIQNERSQLQNKETAMIILRSRLAKLKHEQHQEELSQLKGPNTTEQWGQQIRNYVLHPYTLVKDTRTGEETTDASRVLDGDLDAFIEAYLLMQVGSSN